MKQTTELNFKCLFKKAKSEVIQMKVDHSRVLRQRAADGRNNSSFILHRTNMSVCL